ncbi:MAG: hypothetical protein K8S54_17740, partial [Spirochaetia bacterium]|nr:hypothetical protein [Spirochaetia bacterium]
MRLSFVLSVALYSLCIWLNWSDLNTARPEPNTPAEFSGFYHYLSSDALYAPALFRDLFIESVPTRGWTLPPAPYFFPDLLIYFLVLVFFKQPLAAFVAGTAFFTLSLICAGFFLRTAFPKQKHVYTGVFLAGSLLHLLIIHDLLPASFRGLIVPTFHHGASTCAFIAFALILKGLKDKQPAASFIFLFLLSWAAMLSDSVYAALVVPGTILY